MKHFNRILSLVFAVLLVISSASCTEKVYADENKSVIENKQNENKQNEPKTTEENVDTAETGEITESENVMDDDWPDDYFHLDSNPVQTEVAEIKEEIVKIADVGAGNGVAYICKDEDGNANIAYVKVRKRDVFTTLRYGLPVGIEYDSYEIVSMCCGGSSSIIMFVAFEKDGVRSYYSYDAREEYGWSFGNIAVLEPEKDALVYEYNMREIA